MNDYERSEIGRYLRGSWHRYERSKRTLLGTKGVQKKPLLSVTSSLSKTKSKGGGKKGAFGFEEKRKHHVNTCKHSLKVTSSILAPSGKASP